MDAMIMHLSHCQALPLGTKAIALASQLARFDSGDLKWKEVPDYKFIQTLIYRKDFPPKNFPFAVQ